MSVTETAGHLGLTYETVRKYAGDCEITFADKRGRPPGSNALRNEAIINLSRSGMRARDIALALGITRQHVNRVKRTIGSDGCVEPRSAAPIRVRVIKYAKTIAAPAEALQAAE
jgi:DNA-binding CsgD family transcriptional regulator